MESNKRAVKCQYCDSERIIEKPSQRSFVCCEHTQRIGDLTILNKEKDADAVSNEELEKKKLSNSNHKNSNELETDSTEKNDSGASGEPDSTLEIDEDNSEPVSKSKEDLNYKCPECNSSVTEFGDCENEDCLAEITWQK